MKLRRVKENELNEVMKICNQIKNDLKAKNIPIWDDDYPSFSIFKEDILNQRLWCLKDINIFKGLKIRAVLSISNNIQEELSWDNSKRLEKRIEEESKGKTPYLLSKVMVDVSCQNQGYGSRLLEKLFKEKKSSSFFLLVSSKNLGAIHFYEKNHFHKLDQTKVPWSEDVFYLYGKESPSK